MHALSPDCTYIVLTVLCSCQWLIENLLCLVSNAVKFTTEGMVEVSCSLDMSRDKKPLLRFEVEDTGIGITPQVRSSLFKPFSQAQRCAGGTGLGLYSMSKRMEALGGDCGLMDRRDGEQGSIFWFRIPYVPDIDSAEDRTSPAPTVTGGSRAAMGTYFRPLSTRAQGPAASSRWTRDTQDDVIPFSHDDPQLTALADDDCVFAPVEDPSQSRPACPPSLSVLLVEDSIVIQKSTTKALTRLNAVVDLADNGSIALGLMMRNKYDLVLMDLQMPVSGLDGTCGDELQL